LYWHRFLLAGNTCGRLEVNYQRFCDGPLASFHKKPTPVEVGEMFKEYHRNYLGFLYQADGRLWCQWWHAPDTYGYEKKADKRTPAPPEEAFEAWQQEYRNTKKSEVIDLSQFEVLYETSVESSGKFQKILENSEALPENSEKVENSSENSLGLGSSIGSGLGSGLSISAAKNAAGESRKPSRKSEREPDPRHVFLRDFIKHCIEHATGLKPAPWNGRDARALSDVLAANPSWPAEQFVGLIRNRFRSEDIPRGDPAHLWLATLSRYAEGPLDRFGKLKRDGVGNGNDKAENRLRGNARELLDWVDEKVVGGTDAGDPGNVPTGAT
jgi:hypothetical protein